jgi:NAD(P)-dependent dehydrogenase (short-subunit alcohol dehydrogenase family)
MRCLVITGAGSGIGAATALHFDRLGWRVFAGVHEDDPVLARQGSDRLQVRRLDVTDLSSIKGFTAFVDEELGDEGLTALVNNAGEGVAGPLETLPIDSLRHQLEVNVIGQVSVTQQFLPLLRRNQPRDGSRVVFVGSTGGLVAVQFAGAYHASKYAIEAIGDAWRQELAPDGIHVTILEPGPISTPLWAKAAQTLDALPVTERYHDRLESFRESLRRQSKEGAGPGQVVHLLEHALTATRPRTRYTSGVAAAVVPKVRPLLPDRMFDRLARRATAKTTDFR